jgi:alanine racemase
MRYSIDSRTVIDPVNTIFYAIVGKNRNGHDYVLELYNRGLKNFLVSQMRDEYAGLSDAAFRIVEDTL